MTDYTMRGQWVCFEYTTTSGETVYVEQKLETTPEAAIEKGKEMVEALNGGG
tara:strand:+ start:222 stop:377 length:156 start_codon:yes stop_codon:yes gene_type:complete